MERPAPAVQSGSYRSVGAPDLLARLLLDLFGEIDE